MKPIKNLFTYLTSLPVYFDGQIYLLFTLTNIIEYISLLLSSEKNNNPPWTLLDNTRLGCYRTLRGKMNTRERKVTLIVGGSRSGKSRHALHLAEPFAHKAFIATALPIDDEMKQRIVTHQQERDASFVTIEEPYTLGDAIKALPGETEIAIIDCLTVWLGNLLYKYEDSLADAEEINSFFSVLQHPPCSLILVSNEVGLGIIPADPSTRLFRDEAGSLNQRVAAVANEVIFTISGIPIKIKA